MVANSLLAYISQLKLQGPLGVEVGITKRLLREEGLQPETLAV